MSSNNETDYNQLPCRALPNDEGSAQNPKEINETTLCNLSPVILVRNDKVDAEYMGRPYKRTVSTFYSFTSNKYYRVNLKSDTLSKIMACLEIDANARRFNITQDKLTNKYIWNKTLQ